MNDTSPRPDGTDQSQITVFLLDDHELVRRGLRDLLAEEPDIDVVGEAGTVAAALARLPALHPRVAVLDVRLPDGDGVSVCREIQSTLPGDRLPMLTSYGDDQALFGAIMAGAAGYVLKQTAGDSAQRGPHCGLRRVHAGRRHGAAGDLEAARAASRCPRRRHLLTRRRESWSSSGKGLLTVRSRSACSWLRRP